MSEFLDLSQFFHQLFIDLQAPGRIDDHVVIMLFLGDFHPLAHNFDRIDVGPHFKDRYVNASRHLLQLGNGGWPVNVGCNEEWAGVFFFFEALGQLTGRRRLPGPL